MNAKEFEQHLKTVRSNPTVAGLQFLCSQLEAWDLHLGGGRGHHAAGTAQLKICCLRCVNELKHMAPFVGNENMLRLYQIAGKYSVKVGLSGIYDLLEKEQNFTNSLKFHLLWSESYARKGNAQRFREIVELARRRIRGMSPYELEAGFRDQADKFLPDVRDLFPDDEDTAMLLSGKPLQMKKQKGRRRSSIAAIQQVLSIDPPVQPVQPETFKGTSVFGPKSRSLLRQEIAAANGISPEEWQWAMRKDQMDLAGPEDEGNAMDMDISMTIEPAAVPVPVMVDHQRNQEKEAGALPVPPQPITRDTLPRDSLAESRKSMARMSTLLEDEEASSMDEKRRRIFSPVALDKTREFRRSVAPPKMQASLNPNPPPATNTVTASPNIRSGASFVENAYSNAAALFSDTLRVERAAHDTVHLVDDATMPLESKPAEAFEVFQDESVREVAPPAARQPSHVPSNPPRAVLRPLATDRLSGELVAAEEKDKPLDKDILDLSDIEPIAQSKPVYHMDENEPTLAGHKYQVNNFTKNTGIVTSTPAHFMERPPTHDDFFSTPLEDGNEPEEEESIEEEEDVPVTTAFMKHRRSIVPTRSVAAPPSAPVAPQPPKSMELALDGLRINDSKDTRGDEEEENVLDRTGIERPEEVISGDVNPWSREVRNVILSRAHSKPAQQHDFKTACPKIHRNTDVRLGGETIRLQDLIGEGGFAKVFRCTTGAKETLALKYEVPSCAWEMYICDEVVNRLKQLRSSPSAGFTLECVMQISDGYIFTNASVLLNEYHPYGNLLALASSMKDPAWIMVLFLAIQMAKILRDVHLTEIIHADAKPDNFVVMQKLSDHGSPSSLLDIPVVKLIDWGRAIDMKHLAGRTFQGRSGTDKFECPEMLDGRSWTYQTDFYGWVASVHVLALGKYCNVVESAGGRYTMSDAMKRRMIIRDMMGGIFDRFLNIPSCQELPSWDEAIKVMSNFFMERFNPVEWRAATARFNQSLPQN